MPREMPDPEACRVALERFVGDWEGQENLHPAPYNPKGGSAVGRSRNRFALGGFAVIALALVACTASGGAGSDRKRPPNFVIIYCDDLGYGDIGCFGSEVHRTPNIDRMAREGLMLTSFYVTSGVCTPSRSSLMTGCYPRRVNMHEITRGEWVLFPIALKGLAPDEVTIAEVLRERGYATACIGKWHLGDQLEFLPTRQGFDSYFGIPYSNDMGVKQRRPRANPPLPLLRNETVVEAPAEQTTLTRRYTEAAVRFLRENHDRPFFLYLPHTFPHNPVHASEAFAGKSANGTYGDSVEEIDWSTGQILDTLVELGIDEETLVLFTSDNGASNRFGGSNAPLRGHKGSTWEGGMRVPCVVRWPGSVTAGRSSSELVSTIDLLPTFALLAGAELPPDRKIDGRDVGGILLGVDGATTPHEAFFYYYKDQLQAVRSGRWKLHLPRMKGRGEAARLSAVELYDLHADLAETTNVAKAHPDVVARLEALANSAREDLGDRDRPGAGQRPAGLAAQAVPLTMSERGGLGASSATDQDRE